VADLLIRCGEGDVPLALELALDLAMQLLWLAYSFGEAFG
jgi:hypothetical protein